jgi:hypothetical protein
MSHRRYRGVHANLSVLVFMDDDQRILVYEGERTLLSVRPGDSETECSDYKLRVSFLGGDTVAELSGTHGDQQFRLAVRDDPGQDELVGFRVHPFSNHE